MGMKTSRLTSWDTCPICGCPLYIDGGCPNEANHETEVFQQYQEDYEEYQNEKFRSL